MQNKQLFIWLLLAIASELINAFFATNALVLVISTLVSVIGLCVYLHIVQKASINKILTTISFWGFLVVYFCVRYTTGAIKDSVQNEFSLTQSQYSTFSSNFSLGYGFTQLFSGYLLGRFGSIIISIFAILVGFVLIGMGFINSFTYLCILRFLLGIYCSAASVGMGLFFSSYWSLNLFIPLYMAASFLGLNVASTVTYLSSISFNSVFTWKVLLISLGIIAVLTGILQFIFKPQKDEQLNEESKKEVVNEEIVESSLNDENEKITENSLNNENEKIIENSSSNESDGLSFTEIKNAISDPLIIAMFLFVLGSVPLFYVLNDGWFSLLHKDHTFLVLILNKGSGYAFLSVPFILYFFSTHLLMLLFSIAQIIGIFLIFLFPGSWQIISGATILINLGYCSHIFPTLWYGSNHKGSIVPFIMGLFNFGVMFLGCFLPQKFMGILVDYLSGTNLEKFMFILKMLSVPAIITLICSIYIYIKLSNKEKNQ